MITWRVEEPKKPLSLLCCLRYFHKILFKVDSLEGSTQRIQEVAILLGKIRIGAIGRLFVGKFVDYIWIWRKRLGRTFLVWWIYIQDQQQLPTKNIRLYRYTTTRTTTIINKCIMSLIEARIHITFYFSNFYFFKSKNAIYDTLHIKAM